MISAGATALRAALSAGYLATLVPGWRRFETGCSDPRAVQLARLRRFLDRGAATAYGRDHGYDRIGGPTAFQDRVPIVGYAELARYIERIAAGEPSVLSIDPVRALERTSGSTSSGKLIPYSAEMMRDFAAATSPWLFDLYRRRPRLVGRRSYWSVSPVARERETTAGGIPIGFEDDTEYFGTAARWALAQLMAVPGSVARLRDIAAWRAETIRHLVAAGDLGFLSVWSPTFLTTLMGHLDAALPSLMTELPAARRREIESGLARDGRLTGEALWPRLELVSCWTDGHARAQLPALTAWFPRTEIEGKGLVATEGVISIPVRPDADAAGVVAATSHFLEFIDLAHPGARPKLVDELSPGATYSPVITAGNGFARYQLQDVVECTGFYRRAPRIRFVRRLDLVSDLCGEKLGPADAERAIAAAERALGRRCGFALVAPHPTDTGQRYRMYIDCDAETSRLAAAEAEAESALCEAYHYRYSRDLGQLSPLELVRVANGRDRYEAALTARGVRLGDIKPTQLDTRPIWGGVFAEGGA